MWSAPLSLLPAGGERCPPPLGGQGPLLPGPAGPAVSFIVAMHNNAAVTAQCLLELFRLVGVSGM